MFNEFYCSLQKLHWSFPNHQTGAYMRMDIFGLRQEGYKLNIEIDAGVHNMNQNQHNSGKSYSIHADHFKRQVLDIKKFETKSMQTVCANSR